MIMASMRAQSPGACSIMSEFTRLWGSVWLVRLIAFSLIIACVILCSRIIRMSGHREWQAAGERK